MPSTYVPVNISFWRFVNFVTEGGITPCKSLLIIVMDVNERTSPIVSGMLPFTSWSKIETTYPLVSHVTPVHVQYGDEGTEEIQPNPVDMPLREVDNSHIATVTDDIVGAIVGSLVGAAVDVGERVG